MKKTKLFSSIIATGAIVTALVPLASCSCNANNDDVKESVSFEKKQTVDNTAMYIFELNKDSYKDGDIKVKITGEHAGIFVHSETISGNLLTVKVTIKEIPNEETTYELGLDVTINNKTKSFNNLNITVLESGREPTINENLEYVYVDDEYGPHYEANCKLSIDKRDEFNVKALHLLDTYDDGTNGQLPVAGVVLNGFAGCTKIEKLILPASIKVIRDYAFGCVQYGQFANGNIQKIKFLGSSKLVEIGNYAFCGQEKLTSVKIPASVTSIGACAFYCMNYMEEYGETEEEGRVVYYGSGSLVDVSFEENSKLETIGESAFYGQSKLKSITFPANLQLINEDAFYCINQEYEMKSSGEEYMKQLCSGGLEEIKFEKNSKLETIGAVAFCGQNKLKSLTFPANIASINDNAFCCVDQIYKGNIDGSSSQEIICSGGLETVVFEDNTNLEYIPSECFCGQNKLKSVTNVPASCQSIGSSAFECCNIVEIHNTKNKLTEARLTCCGSLEEFKFNKDCKIEKIGSESFRGQKQLETFALPNSVTSIYDSAFCCCDIIEKLGLMDLTPVGNLKNFNIDIDKSSLVNISEWCFNGQKELTEINIPTTLDYYSSSVDGAFTQCYKLKFNVKNGGDFKIIDNGAGLSYNYNDGAYTGLVCYPSASGNLDLSKYNFTFIAHEAFAYNKLLESIVLPEYEYPGDEMFNHCSNLKKVTISKDTWSIRGTAFVGCDNLVNFKSNSENFETISVGSNNPILVRKDENDVKLICAYPTAPASLDFTDAKFDDISGIFVESFVNNHNITSVKMNKNFVEIGNHAFYNCKNLKSIDLQNVQKFGTDENGYRSSPIKGCNNINTIKVNNDNTHLKVINNKILVDDVNFDSNRTLLYFISQDDRIKLDFSSSDYGLNTIKRINSNFTNAQILELTSFGNVEQLGEGVFEGVYFGWVDQTKREAIKITIPSTLNRIEAYAFATVGINEIIFTTTSGWTFEDSHDPCNVSDPIANVNKFKYRGEFYDKTIVQSD